MKRAVEAIKTWVRVGMRMIAGWLDHVSGGRITPDSITLFGVAMHVPIAVLIAKDHFVLAAVLLVIFGLFDTLDGELARLQKRASVRGMLLDASTDRIKEVMLYTGVGYILATGPHPSQAALAVAAVGASVCVSYVKAKGEAAVATSGKEIPHATLNRMFSDGILTFEIRMVLLVAGLLFDQLAIVAALVALGASVTFVQRLIRIGKRL